VAKAMFEEDVERKLMLWRHSKEVVRRRLLPGSPRSDAALSGQPPRAAVVARLDPVARARLDRVLAGRTRHAQPGQGALHEGNQQSAPGQGACAPSRHGRLLTPAAPSKVNSDNLEHKMLAQGIFYTLNQAWDIFKVQNGL
jgi:hypothetical protein